MSSLIGSFEQGNLSGPALPPAISIVEFGKQRSEDGTQKCKDKSNIVQSNQVVCPTIGRNILYIRIAFFATKI